MVPVGVYIIFGLFLAVVIVAGMALIVSLARQIFAEREVVTVGWDTGATSELTLWRQEQDKERVRCPHCKGTRCWDYRREGRPCGDDPTTAELNPDPLAQGRHFNFTVKRAPSGWWPLPRTRAARINPDLWRKVADHCQISLSRRPGLVLP